MWVRKEGPMLAHPCCKVAPPIWHGVVGSCDALNEMRWEPGPAVHQSCMEHAVQPNMAAQQRPRDFVRTRNLADRTCALLWLPNCMVFLLTQIMLYVYVSPTLDQPGCQAGLFDRFAVLVFFKLSGCQQSIRMTARLWIKDCQPKKESYIWVRDVCFWFNGAGDKVAIAKGLQSK
eukprot:1146629-Pelagomonas_calceolata.AAC.2